MRIYRTIPFSVDNHPCECGCGKFTALDQRGRSQQFRKGHAPKAPRPSVSTRLWPKIAKTENPDECWLWTGWVNNHGYGSIDDRGKAVYVHRLAYELTYGPIPDGLVACHRCDTPRCCNPAHIFLGTMKDNLLDAKAKHRTAHGEHGSHAKLTASQVLAIRQRRAAGAKGHDLATEFNISPQHALAIVRGDFWTHPLG